MSRRKDFLDFLESDIGDLIGKVITADKDKEQKKHELLKAEAIKRPILTAKDTKTIHDLLVYRYKKYLNRDWII